MVASDLKRGCFFEYKGKILQVVNKSLVNCGTHSHTKLVFKVCDLYGKTEKDLTLGHHDSVDVLLGLEHLAEINMPLGFRPLFVHPSGVLLVYIAQRDDVLAGDRAKVGKSPPPNTHSRDVQLLTGRFLSQTEHVCWDDSECCQGG